MSNPSGVQHMECFVRAPWKGLWHYWEPFRHTPSSPRTGRARRWAIIDPRGSCRGARKGCLAARFAAMHTTVCPTNRLTWRRSRGAPSGLNTEHRRDRGDRGAERTFTDFQPKRERDTLPRKRWVDAWWYGGSSRVRSPAHLLVGKDPEVCLPAKRFNNECHLVLIVLCIRRAAGYATLKPRCTPGMTSRGPRCKRLGWRLLLGTATVFQVLGTRLIVV